MELIKETTTIGGTKEEPILKTNMWWTMINEKGETVTGDIFSQDSEMEYQKELLKWRGY